VIEILPLWVLYEGSIWLSVMLDRRDAKPQFAGGISGSS
jgi:Sec-independent protein secretion pathway component TatC